MKIFFLICPIFSKSQHLNWSDQFVIEQIVKTLFHYIEKTDLKVYY